MKLIDKWIPGDVRVKDEYDELTFLADKKIKAELYVYFLSKSYPINNQTIVKKKDLGTVAEICSAIRVKSNKTYYNYLHYLLDKEYILECKIDKEDAYVLCLPNQFYFSLPLKTILFLQDVVKEDVVKTYTYLGRQFEVNKSKGITGYDFTLKELAQHIGMKLSNNSSQYDKLKNYLLALEHFGMIELVQFYKENENGIAFPRLKIIKLEKSVKNFKNLTKKEIEKYTV